MYTLYGSKATGSVIAEMGLHVAGLDYRVVDAASWDEKSAIDELRKVNPLVQIPTLVLPNDSVLTESATILMHLARAAGPGGRRPAGGAARARGRRGRGGI